MQRKSLIIGINNYNHFSVLENALNDAIDMHTLLSEHGFESKLLTDSTQDELIQEIREFKKSLGENDVSLIYFSGHGLEDNRHNFLVAADSEVRFVEDIPYHCVKVDDLFIENSKTNLHIVILDACRNNPFYSGNKGHSVGFLKMEAPAGTLIAFSTSPKATSIERPGERNGIYTKHLLKCMKMANVPVEMIFKATRNKVIKDTEGRQVPWEESSLIGDDFSFVTIKEESIQDFIIGSVLTNRNVTLPELMPFLSPSAFKIGELEVLLQILAIVKIAFSNEQEQITKRTVDEDHFNDLMFEQFYPIFEEKLIIEDNASDNFEIEMFGQLCITRGPNFGYNALEDPEDSFPQIMANFVSFNDEDGILCFYLSTIAGEHMLKPAIITVVDNHIKFYDYAIVTGTDVIAIFDHFFAMRKPFEKDIPSLDNFWSVTTQVSEEELRKFFGE